MVSNQPQGPKIGIRVNGEPRQVPQGLHVRALLGVLGLDGGRVAVELDRQIVRKAEWEQTLVRDGAALEIVTFVGGG